MGPVGSDTIPVSDLIHRTPSWCWSISSGGRKKTHTMDWFPRVVSDIDIKLKLCGTETLTDQWNKQKILFLIFRNRLISTSKHNTYLINVAF